MPVRLKESFIEQAMFELVCHGGTYKEFMESLERDLIYKILDDARMCGRSNTWVANKLGLKRTTLIMKRKKYGLKGAR